MSSIQRRSKNIFKIPLLDMTETQSEIPFTDPRSPSANIARTPVEGQAYTFPPLPTTTRIPINSTR